MRTTTRLALALFVAVILALVIYAYPSWSGFVTLAFRAAAIVGVLAIAALLLAAMTNRRPGRLDLILALAAIGIVVASWNQVSAVADANRLDGEIAAAGEENVLAVLEATETNTGALVREANRLRAEADTEIAFLLVGLWDEERLAVLIGPAAVDEAELARAMDLVALLREAEERARGTVDAVLDAEAEAIAAIETPLPDSARLVFVDAAIARVTADRAYYHQRLAIVADRLIKADEMVALLQANLGTYRFDEAALRLAFDNPDVGARYTALIGEIETTWATDQALIDAHAAGNVAGVLALVEAAGTTP